MEGRTVLGVREVGGIKPSQRDEEGEGGRGGEEEKERERVIMIATASMRVCLTDCEESQVLAEVSA